LLHHLFVDVGVSLAKGRSGVGGLHVCVDLHMAKVQALNGALEPFQLIVKVDVGTDTVLFVY
jgi:hypothetical protein